MGAYGIISRDDILARKLKWTNLDSLKARFQSVYSSQKKVSMSCCS